MKLKAERLSVAKITQAAFASALGITQPSVSELLKYGRLAKENVPALLDYFSDVVGPDHFGLPFSKFEMDLVKELRKLPARSQAALMDRVKLSVAAVEEATKGIDAPLEIAPQKRQAMIQLLQALIRSHPNPAALQREFHAVTSRAGAARAVSEFGAQPLHALNAAAIERWRQLIEAHTPAA